MVVFPESLEYRLLDPWIIKYNEERERKKRERQRQQVEIPLPVYVPTPKDDKKPGKSTIIKIETMYR